VRARLGIGIAAATAIAALVFLAWPFLSAPPEDDVPPGAPRALSPVGDIPRSPSAFVWTSDPDAESYRVELRGPADTLLWRTVVAETTLVLPAGLVDWNIIAYGQWHVTSQRSGGAEAQGPAAVFRIDSP
jgi:hypothetical protein